MALFDTASMGWEIAGLMACYTIVRNLRQDSKAARAAKEQAFKEAVAGIAECKTRLDQNERELTQLVEIVKKSADLNLLVAGLASSVKSLESGVTEVKSMYRDLQRTLNSYIRAQRPQ